MINLLQGKYEIAKKHYADATMTDFFEFDLSYVPKNEHFRELDRFLWESKHTMTRFKNRYDGPVLINLTSWNSKEVNEYFEAFMYFLKDSPGLKCTFIVENKCNEQLLENLESFFEIKVMELTEVKEKEPKRKIGFIIEEEVGNNV